MTRGIYVEPAAVAESPDYARVLVEEAGVQVFQLRAGFDPSQEAPGVVEAIEVVRKLNARVWFLVGTWWGHGVEPGEDRMAPVAAQDRAGLAPAHEAQWAMRTPGGPADQEIERTVTELCRRYQPNGICLTHARFRHPADLPGLFEWGEGTFAEIGYGEGLTPNRIKETWDDAMNALGELKEEELRNLVEAYPIAAFIDVLGGGDLMERWFTHRFEMITKSVKRFAAAARKAGSDGIQFGVNAYRPSAARLVGQDYIRLSAHCDFIQPLLGYIRWHVLHPVGAWARLLAERGRDIDEADAIEMAAELFGLDPNWVPTDLESYAQPDEGDPDAIFDLVEAEYMLAGSFQTAETDIIPVLRGRDWPVYATGELEDAAENLGFGGLFFQGTDHLGGPPPGEGWG